MRIPIRYQFMLPLFVVAVASLSAVGVLNAHLATRQTKSRIEKQLRGVAAVLAESSYPLTDAVLRQMGELANAKFILTDSMGVQIASGTSESARGLVADELTARTVENLTLGTEMLLGSKPYFHSWVPVEHRPHVAASSVLHILFAQDDFDAAWRATFVPPVLVGLVTVVVVTLVTHVVAGRVSGVLTRLKGDVARLADGDFSDIWQPAWNDETRELAIAVNHAAKRLADFQTELQQAERARTIAMLGAGLAHEMRNAATGCRLAVDLHAEHCPGEIADDSLDVARRQLVLMENRLQQLLHLGRERPISNERPLDLSLLVSETVALIKPAAQHAGICLLGSTAGTGDNGPRRPGTAGSGNHERVAEFTGRSEQGASHRQTGSIRPRRAATR